MHILFSWSDLGLMFSSYTIVRSLLFLEINTCTEKTDVSARKFSACTNPTTFYYYVLTIGCTWAIMCHPPLSFPFSGRTNSILSSESLKVTGTVGSSE